MSSVMTRWIVALAVATLAMGLVLAHAAVAQEAAGQWHGEIALPDQTIRVGVEIAKGADGQLSGFATSPDQTPDKIPIEAIGAEKGQFHFTSAAIAGAYEANWDAAKNAWVGEWRQNGQVMPLVLEKGPVPPARP